ncbi:hypothetical protein N0V94_008975 [Neodidymelliopsis sp. IMI 364377]|nr:hypothetical protein N0V94_008975 [Neodidymelliopsis sp. IMI 364377]
MAKESPVMSPATKLILSTENMAPGWVDHALGRIPIWLEHGPLPKVPRGVLYMTPEGIEAFDASVWICVAEVQEIFGLKPKYGQRGEWLACGYLPRSMVEAQATLPDREQHISSLPLNMLRRSGSIRSFSSEEQEEHIKEQIARNRASKESLRTNAEPVKQRRRKGSSLLKQATENWQIRRTSEDSLEGLRGAEMHTVEGRIAETPQTDAYKYVPRSQQTPSISSLDSARCDESVKETNARYASVRSSKLREALERKRAEKSTYISDDMGDSPKSTPWSRKRDGRCDLEGWRRLTLSSDEIDKFDTADMAERSSCRVWKQSSIMDNSYEHMSTVDPGESAFAVSRREEAEPEGIVESKRRYGGGSKYPHNTRMNEKDASFFDAECEGEEVYSVASKMSDITSVAEELDSHRPGTTHSKNEPVFMSHPLSPIEEELACSEDEIIALQRSATTRALNLRTRSGSKIPRPIVRAPTGTRVTEASYAQGERQRAVERPSSKFFDDLGCDFDDDKPRLIKVKPRDVGW